jgi:transcriptional regulator with XRE-family HTH domain
MSPFASQLRALRQNARRSQMDLALEAGVSQRHLSFLETGRSRPGRGVVEKLARALALSAPVANAFMASAGYAPLFAQRSWSDEDMAPIRRAAAELLRRHAPYPAVLIDAAADVIAVNSGFNAALGLIDDPDRLWARTHPSGEPRNLLRLSLHPEGPAAAMVNFETVARATLQRAHAEAPGSERLEAVLTDISAWPNIDPTWIAPQWGPPPAPIIEERYKTRDFELALFAVITSLGAPMDAAANLRVESFFPADEASRELLDRLSPITPAPV